MPCWGGLDLSTTKDITALVWLFAMGDRLVLLPQFFMPRGNIEGREKMDAVRYSSWIANGFITATEGDRVDYGVVRAKILEGKQLFDVQEIGYDTWNATEIVNRLTDDKVKMVPVKQGYQLLPASKEFERLVAAGMITHPGNPVLDWMAGNVEVITSAQENIMLVKPFAQDSATQRIDGIVASVMAMERYTRRGASSKSVYESRGVQVI